jgi:CIC family chloride channel protein
MFVVLGMMTTFGAAARVPIASMLMVTEMTGGYRLLPPAAFTVLLSYLVQTQLSAHLKYTSLYEAQVPGRAQSPARYAESVQTALQLLGTQRIPNAATIGHLDLVTLLDSGLRPESSFVGKTIQSCYEAAAGASLEIIAILRNGEVLLPQADTVLQENDRLLIIGSSKARSRIAEHFVPLEPKGQPSRSTS